MDWWENAAESLISNEGKSRCFRFRCSQQSIECSAFLKIGVSRPYTEPENVQQLIKHVGVPINGYKWGYPQTNHPLLDGIFHDINHPASPHHPIWSQDITNHQSGHLSRGPNFHFNDLQCVWPKSTSHRGEKNSRAITGGSWWVSSENVLLWMKIWSRLRM